MEDNKNFNVERNQVFLMDHDKKVVSRNHIIFTIFIIF